MKADRGLWLALLNGVIAFFALTRGAILDPRNTDYLFRNFDSATGFLGWQFFRQSPVLQLPFGANPSYGMEIASSVVFTDSIPLAAFLFKPFSGSLPATFQYFGVWVLLSFVLQSLFAYKLLRRFSQDQWLALAGSAFFLIAPVYLYRLGGHFALFAQWVVLAALWLYFAPRFAPWRWTLLLCCGALIHFYLLVMACAIWAADLLQRRWRDDITVRQAAAYAAAGSCATALVMWLAGYFMLGTAAAAMPGFGIYRMNLLALVDPDRVWSRLLPDQPSAGSGEFEGFNYLGIGILLLAPLAAYCLLAKRRGSPADRRVMVPLLLAALALGLLALSNRVALGDVELLDYEIPELLRPAFDVLRGSGRLFWPVYYLIYLAVLVLVLRGLPRRAAIAACAAALAVQVADSAPALRYYSNRLADPPAWSSPLKSPLWAEIGARYKRVIYVLPHNGFHAFLPWAVFAATHGMAINFGYFARVDAEKLTAARNDIEAAVLGNRLQRDSVYVFDSEALWSMASARRRASDVVGVLDGFPIIAPNLKECAACDLRALADVREEFGGYRLGERISFADGESRRKYAVLGWSLPQRRGMWSQSQVASLVIRLEQAPQHDLVLAIEGRAFVNIRHPRQEIDVSVNGVMLETLVYVFPGDSELKTLRIPRAALSGSKGFVMVQFAFRNAKSPRELGLGDDARPRGLQLTSVRLSAA